MSRGVFNSQNKVGEVLFFNTTSSSGTTFDPSVSFVSGLDRVSWDLGLGSGYTTGNNQSITYPDNGTVKNCQLRTNRLSEISVLNFFQDNIYGDLDLTKFYNLYYVSFGGSSQLSAVTHSYSPTPIIYYDLSNCNITGQHNISMLDVGDDFQMDNNSSLSGVTHTASTQSFTRYTLNSCDITGTHDLSMFPKLSGDFRVHTNSNLTKLIHTNTDPSAPNFTRYWAFNCNLTGEHDMSVLTNIGGQIYLNSNPSLTGVTHSPTTGTITRYWSYGCDLTGNHDLSMFPKLGGSFQFFSNSNLTSITHTANTDSSWSLYTGSNCDLTGNHDMSWCPNLGGNFNLSSNPNLTGITHTASTKVFTLYQLQSCSIKTHDISMLTGLGGFFSMAQNLGLSGITNPVSTQVFTDYNLNDCNFTSGIDFYPLSGANFANGEIRLDDNNMSAAVVNTMLHDFSGITSNNVNSWSGVTLNISGSNSAPDTTSGGINGVASLSYLTGATPQWSITTS